MFFKLFENLINLILLIFISQKVGCKYNHFLITNDGWEEIIAFFNNKNSFP
jgi:hypothetical protein